MKISSFLFAAILLIGFAAPLVAHAEPPPTTGIVPKRSADADWVVIESMKAEGRTGTARDPRPSLDKPIEVLQWRLRFYNRYLAAVDEFYEKYPEDTRRWTGVADAAGSFNYWTSTISSDAQKQAADAAMSAVDRDRWKARLEQLRLAGIGAKDTPGLIRLNFDSKPFDQARSVAIAALREKKPVDLAALKAEINRLIATHPDEPSLGYWVILYVETKELAGVSRDELKAEWQTLAKSSSELARNVAEERLRFYELTSHPLDIAFTAVDGHPVDLKSLRGKVVLVCFWATWCPPCIAKVPNLKRIYAAYHDKGFEIVGISLENASVRSTDTPEQAAAKLEKAKKVLTDFTAENQMLWPQYFDGKGWKNDISKKYSINALPAMFLLDLDGKVVSTNAEGDELEREVKRLLQL